MTRIVVTPVDALLDEPVAIRLADVEPHSRVRVRLRSEAFKAEAAADFVADEAGSVDISAQGPVSGDYEGIDPGGLFWAARFDEGADLLGMLAALTRLEPLAYTATIEAGGVELSRAHFTRTLLARDVVRTDVRDGRIRATLFAPNGATRAPGVLVLGGSDGGNNFTFIGALLAAHGFAALSLAYFAYEDLPREFVELPLEYFREAIDWLRNRPEVGGAGVAVFGMSRGGELALLLGATYPEIAAVVALVPSGVAGSGIGMNPSMMMRPAWTLAGQPIPFLPPPSDPEWIKAAQDAFMKGTPIAGTPGVLRVLERAGAPVQEAAIKVEQTRGPIFMMSAEDDQVWPSTQLTELAVDRLQASGFAYPFEHRSYSGAGHWACLPPHVPTTTNWSRHPQVPIALAYGGNARDTAAASRDAWPRVLAFLEDHLAPSR